MGAGPGGAPHTYPWVFLTVRRRSIKKPRLGTKTQAGQIFRKVEPGGFEPATSG